MDSFRDTLKGSLNKMDALSQDNCTAHDAAAAWGASFNDPFFDTVIEQKSLAADSAPAIVKGLLPAEAFAHDGTLREEMESVQKHGGNRFG